MSNLDKQAFIKKQRQLLEVEQNEEIDQIKSLLDSSSPKYLEELGLCVRKLKFSGESGGLFGKRVVTLTLESALRKQKRGPDNNSTLHIFGPGDIVAVFRSGEDELPSKDETTKESKTKKNAEISGVVYRVSNDSLTIAVDDERIELDDRESIDYHVIRLTNDLTFRRMRTALDKLDSTNRFRSISLISTLFGDLNSTAGQLQLNDIEFGTMFKCAPDAIPFSNVHLDESQREAVQFALRQRYVSIVHGPPGTGKTTTLIEIIAQLVRSGQKVLACAPSNVAVDNLAERLVDSVSRRIVRIGHPARANARVQPFTLDALLSSTSEVDAAQLCADVRAELDAEFVALRRVGRDRADRAAIRERISALRAELREREHAAVRHVLGDADVVLATLTSAGDDGPLRCLADNERFFDVVLIDECSQAIEAACWIAIGWARKLIIAGDHLQLPPTVVSQRAARDGLAVSLMERLLDDTFCQQPSLFVRMLTVQYRMNETIMNFSSHQLYADQLTAAESVRSHLLRDLAHIRGHHSKTTDGTANNEELAETAFLYIDTAGCGMCELQESAESRMASSGRRDRSPARSSARRALDGTQSKANPGECELVYQHVAKLVDELGLNENDIAVMSPYNRQVDLLRAALSERFANVEVRTIDAFQGREKEAVVLSLVRSNDQLEIGFLADRRRLNVAITRARRHLCVIADSDTLRGRPEEAGNNDAVLKPAELQQSVASDAVHSTPESQTCSSCPAKKSQLEDDADRQTREAYRLGRAFLRAFVEYCELTDSVHYWTPCVYAALSAQDSSGTTELETNEAFQRLRNRLTSAKVAHAPPARTRSGASSQIGLAPKTRTVVKKESSLAKDSALASKESHLKKLKLVISEFLEDPNKLRLEFPTSLTSYERALVHSLAEEAGVAHTSVGEAENRRIILFKREHEKTMENEATDESRCLDIAEQDAEVHEDEAMNHSATETCDTEPQADCKRVDATTIQKKKKKKKPKPAATANTNNSTPTVQTIDVESALERAAANGNDDALLAEAKRLNERCNVIGCRERERHVLIGTTCKFCAKRFCVHHAIPELHGCGDAAKADARATYRKQMLNAAAAASAPSTSAASTTGRSPGCYGSSEQKTAIRREFLQKKLDKKLDKLGANRKPHSGNAKK